MLIAGRQVDPARGQNFEGGHRVRRPGVTRIKTSIIYEARRRYELPSFV
jgi:hypothetical protein